MTKEEWFEEWFGKGSTVYGFNRFDTFVGLHRPLQLVLCGMISKEAPAFKHWLAKQPKSEREIITDLLLKLNY